jgi:hypothetical protein
VGKAFKSDYIPGAGIRKIYTNSTNIDSILELGEAYFLPEDAQIWRNMSSFVARCMGAGIIGPSTPVINALREALEENLATDWRFSRAVCKLQVACEYIAHGALPLLW